MTLRPDTYRARAVDPLVEAYLRAFGAVEIIGSKWCGKTWTALAHGNSVIRLDDPHVRALVEADPDLALEGESPHIVDEWQEVPSVWDATRRAVDDAAGKKGLFLLTGSSSPSKGSVVHSGTGRIARLHMRPMSLSELGESDETVSFSGLFEGEFRKGPVNTDLRRIAQLICQGGWPASLTLEEDASDLIAAQYLDTLLSSDFENGRPSAHVMRRLLVSLARNLGGAVTYKTLAADLSEGQDVVVQTRQAIERYLEILEDRYIIENLSGWDAPVKSRSRVRVKPKRSFVDPSLPASLLGMSPTRLMGESQVFGQLFEEMCLRDLRVYASAMRLALPEPVRYYRDSDGLEVDAVIELRDGRWAGIEVKLGDNKAEEGARSLLRLRDKVAANPAARNPEPSFLMVLVAKAPFRYQTPEGVYVVPLTSLTT